MYCMTTRIFVASVLASGCIIINGGLVQANKDGGQGFILTGPRRLLAGSTETFCVSVKDVTHSVANCTLNLIVDKSIMSSVNHRLNGIKECFKLKVPMVENSNAELQWRMHFDGLPDYKVDLKKEIAVTQTEMEPLIQTDKAWYIPGQLVRFRILSLNHMLHPILHPINRIWVEDPTGTAIIQWKNVTTNHGIIQQELQLSQEPVQGLWKIRMEREPNKRKGAGQQEFEVREYILPRFEVVINSPPSISYNQEGDRSVQKIPIGICAKYSYGQPVKGTWKANIKVENKEKYYHRAFDRDQADTLSAVNIDKSGVLNDVTGCHTLKLSGNELGITTNDGTIDKTIVINATVIEQGTDLEANATWSTNVKTQKLVMDISSWSSSTFKNGLPYYGTMKLRMEGGNSAVNGTLVEICIQISNYNRPKRSSPVDQQRLTEALNDRIRSQSTRFGRQRNPLDRDNRRGGDKGPQFCSQYMSDSQGFVYFQFIPTDPEAIEYQLKATVFKLPRVKRQAAGPLGELSAQTEFTIQSSYSPSNSYLSFVPPTNFPAAAPCNSTLPIKLYFTADNKTDKLNLHYMVTSRGDVLHSGVLPVTYRKVDKVHLPNSLSIGAPKMNLDVGSVVLELDIKPEFSPKMTILAYYIRGDKEVVTAVLDLEVDSCFPNPVKFSWASKKRQPGQNVSFHLKSGAGSICGYSVVDRSVTFIRPDLQLSESKIFSPLSHFHIDRYSRPQQVTPDWKYCADKVYDEEEKIRDQPGRPARSIEPWLYDRSTTQVKDAMDAFQNSGLIVISDMNIETRPCIKRYVDWAPRMMASPMMGRSASITSVVRKPNHRTSSVAIADVGQNKENREIPEVASSYENVVDLTTTVAVRTYFPETWLWDLVHLDFKGELKTTVELPHTISNWVGKALCVSETDGFGMSSPAEIEVFQPFFLELHLPYSVKRTEKLKLKVAVFNYAKQALPIRLTLDRSEAIQVVGNGTSDYSSAQLCVPPQTNLVHHFHVYATELGRHNITVTAAIDDAHPGECGSSSQQGARDTVVKELFVQPEGFPVERLFSEMVCPKDFDEDKSLVWDLSLPSDLVQGSARAWITAVGDLMGPALQGLTGLVRLPMGCGEQNMVLFTPIIYVVRYLSATNQLDESIKKKSLDFMKTGYQRELNYRHDDGSYSAFGKSDHEGSLWLTAFVIKSFAAAHRYIHIDGNDLKTSVNWLISQQQSTDGCFPTVGTVLHHDLKGGLSGDKNDLTPLTAFTLIALLEARESQQDNLTNNEELSLVIVGDHHQVMDKALSCLSSVSGSAPVDPYTTALTAYALALANRTEEARKKIDWMMNHAQRNQSLIWWHKTGSGPALSVEMTSYVLLSLVKLGSKQNMVDARSIVRWLSKQRNSEGGFISTQDTVVGLQAIAAYAESIGTQPINMKVTVNAEEFSAGFQMTESDRLVQRRIDLPSPLASSVEIDSVGEGEGCAIIQSTLRYNVHRPPPSEAFQLNVTHFELTEGSCSRGRRIKVCARYAAPGDASSASSNMVLIELSLTSGYEADKQSLEALVREQKTTLVKRFELKQGDVVVLYFDEMVVERDYCVGVDVRAAFEVNDAKDANVKIYDYYQPEHAISVSYNLLPSAGVIDDENGCDMIP